MAWIKVVPESEADGSLKEAYDKVPRWKGRVANIIRVHSLSPPVLLAHDDLYRRLMYGPSELSRRERETIAVAVSATNRCHY